MNYDVYEVELETGIAGYRLLQHVKAVDAADAQAKAVAAQGVKAIAVLYRRPCTDAEIAKAVTDGLVPVGTVATALADVPVDLIPVQVAA